MATDPTGRISHIQDMHRGLTWKPACRVATTANITISTALNNGDTLDGITLATGDRVLVKNQSTASQNGIYIVGATPTRAADMDQDTTTTTIPAEEIAGAWVYVISGTAGAGTLWRTTNAVGGTIGSTSITWTQVVSSSSGSLPWFNVMAAAYGAVNDGSTNDRTAINAAIAAFNAAGKGVLYFPAGTGYAVSGGALTTITADGLVIGDGMGAYDGSAYVSAILFNSQTAVCFTHTGKTLQFRDLGIFNTYSGTPSAGAGIQVSGSFIGQKVDIDSCVISGFYVNVDRQVGSQWADHNVWNWKAVLYGEKIQNTVNQDAGDWAILGGNYYADTHNATAAIYQIGAGGGKIAGTKINGHGGATYTNGILVAWPAATDSSILAISATSIENVSGDAILITTSATGSFGLVAIAGLEVGLYSNNTGRAVKITASNAGGAGTAGAFYGAVIDGLIARTDGTARAAVELTKTDHVTLGDFALVGFNARYTSTSDTNTIDDSSASFATPSIALGSSAAAGVASTVIRSDSTIAAFDATVPVTQAFSDAAATGSAAFAARRDHRHGMPASPTVTAGVLLIADTHSTPIIFADVILNEATDDFLYSD